MDRASIVQHRRNLELIAAKERLPLKTGFCLAGFHEGSKPKNREGDGIKTCDQYETCPCKCHTDLDELFELSGKVRELVTNPFYKPVIGQHLVQPTVLAAGVLSGEQNDPDAIVSPAPGIVPGEKAKEFAETPSGRWARGQLEHFVKAAIDVWVVEGVAEGLPNDRRIPCTPQWIATQVSEMQGVAEPELGGVNSVLSRWKTQGIATTAEKPFRFVGYTAEAIEQGMDRMRDKAKRDKRSTMAF